MITPRPAHARGHADHGWLQSAHSFSFGSYQDPQHMGFGNLRVINEDRVAPGGGFATHGHRDMEIVSIVLSGGLAHQDSLGTGATIWPGDIQRMSAGTGIRHSEFNHSPSAETHFLQIWFLPDAADGVPSYEQRRFADEDKRGRLRLVVSPDGEDGSVSMRADARIRAGLFDGDEAAELALDPQRLTYVHLVRGELTVNDHRLNAGDALLMRTEAHLSLSRGDQAEVLVFDLAAEPSHTA